MTGIQRNPLNNALELKSGDRGHASKPHAHSSFSISLVVSGQTRFSSGGYRRTLGPGDFVCIAPGIVHLCTPLDPSSFRYQSLYLPGEWADFVPHSQSVQFGTNSADELSQLFQSIITSESREHSIGLLQQNIAKAMFTAPESTSDLPDQPIDFSGSTPTNFAMYGSSEADRYRLYRYYKQAYGAGASTCAQILRIEEAKRLLLSGLPLAQTALACGFYDQSHFSRFFRAHTGVSPGKYRG